MMAEVERLPSSSAADREALRQAFGEQLQSLAAAVEQCTRRNEQFQHAMRQAIDTRLGEPESRTTRRFDDMDANLAGMVQDVARPLCRRSATTRPASSAGSTRSTPTCAGSTSRRPGWSPTSTR